MIDDKIKQIFENANILKDNETLTEFELIKYEIVNLQNIKSLLALGYNDINITSHAHDWECSDLKITLYK